LHRVVILDGETMGTTWSVRIACSDTGLPDPLRSGITSVLDRVIAQMSNWEKNSDISRFNRAPPGEWQHLSDDFALVLRSALLVAERSDGAFDPTIGRAVDHWGFGPAAYRMPGTPPTHTRGWRGIDLADLTARRTENADLDFSGIAKGFAVDAISEYLVSAGFPHCLVEIGGELRGNGVKPDGQPWWVELEHPPGLTLPVTRVALSGLAIATSGDYRRFFNEGGQSYAHTIDPATGKPLSNGLASVTVIHESAMMADAWATALMVLGFERGMQIADHEKLAALIVARIRNGAKEYISPLLAQMTDV